MRYYEVAHLSPDHQTIEKSTLAPAAAPFEDCFAALGRGAVLKTLLGPMAIEDIFPGDTIITASHGAQIVRWRGMMQIVPGAQNSRPEIGTVTRITTEALGYARPTQDLVVGPAARIAHRAPGMKRLTGSERTFVPLRDFIDDTSVIELQPIAPVDVYQLGFDHHCAMDVGGVEIESLHPGLRHMMGLRVDLQQTLMSLFPHKASLDDFGPLLHPRIRMRDLDLFAAG